METVRMLFSGEDNFFVQEAYKVLRTNLLFCGQGIKTVAITSCMENEGKTTVSLNAARSFADLGKKTLLIDADMRKSVLAGRNSDVRDAPGLSEVLTGIAPLREAVFSTQIANLHVLFSGKYPPNPAELLGSRYFAELIAGAKEAYDYVFVDTPPLGQVIDAAAVAARCDGTVLVIGDKVSVTEARRVMEQLKKSECRILGAVRNCVRRHSVGYYGKKKKSAYAYGKEKE